jgi:hypothetical protein
VRATTRYVSDTTIFSPFFAYRGYHPRYDFELDKRVDTPEEREAQTAVERLPLIHEVARSEMRYAQVRHWDVGCMGRWQKLAYRTSWPESGKQAPRPLPVIRTIGIHACQLDIPAAVPKHRTFPVSLLHDAADGPARRSRHATATPGNCRRRRRMGAGGSSRQQKIRGRVQYLVKWRGSADPASEPRGSQNPRPKAKPPRPTTNGPRNDWQRHEPNP